MSVQKINRITRYEIDLMPPTPSEPTIFGWIRLLDADVDAGYVYLTTPPVSPRLGSTGYIVTSIPMSELQVMLDILRNEPNLQIRYFDPQSDGVGPSVFIETALEKAEASNEKMKIPEEVVSEILNHRRSQAKRGAMD